MTSAVSRERPDIMSLPHLIAEIGQGEGDYG